MPSEPEIQVLCPKCGAENPLGFVWCRKCKGSLAAPKKQLRWPFPPAITGGLVGGALVALIFLVARRPDPPAAGGEAATNGAAKPDPQKALANWAAGGTPGAPTSAATAADTSMTLTQEPDAPTVAVVTSAPAAAVPPPASTVAAATAAAAPKAHLTGMRQEGDQIVYEVAVDMNGKSYPVTVKGHIDESSGHPQFVPDDVDSGELPVDQTEMQNMLDQAFAGPRGPGRRHQ